MLDFSNIKKRKPAGWRSAPKPKIEQTKGREKQACQVNSQDREGAECSAGDGEHHEVHGGWLTFCVFPLPSCLALCVCGFVLRCAVP